MEVVMWVAVGIFVVAAGGAPDVGVAANGEPFKTLEECAAANSQVPDRVENSNIPVVAFGTACTRVTVKAREASPEKKNFTPSEKSGGTVGGKTYL